MKYMQEGGFKNHPLMRLTLSLTLLFLLGLWVTNFYMYFSKMGLTAESVATYYLGSEADFRPARTVQSMLEVTHFHLPIMAVVLLLLTHLLIFAPFSMRSRIIFISVAFLSAFLNEGSSWLVRFVHPAFAYLKIFCFFTFQTSFLFLMAALTHYLWLQKNDQPHQQGIKIKHRPHGDSVPDHGHKTDKK